MLHQNLPVEVSLEQARYQDRLNKASLRQNHFYKQNLDRISLMSEKEKYAQSLEQKQSMQAHYSGGAMSAIEATKTIPLGKYVSQMEMLQPGARQHLKEILE